MNSTFISRKYKPHSIDDFSIKDDFAHVIKSFIGIENLNLICH